MHCLTIQQCEMKTKLVEQKVTLDHDQVLASATCNLHRLPKEELVTVFKMLYPDVENIAFDLATDKFSYSVYSNELMTWDEEVSEMSDIEVLRNIHKLLVKYGLIKDFPGFSGNVNVISYLREVLRENENVG